MQSRHVLVKQHQLWIRYEADSLEAIKGWYCQCKNCARTVGCCFCLWYLGYQRHQEKVSQYRSDEYSDYILDAANWPESDDSEQKEEEEEVVEEDGDESGEA